MEETKMKTMTFGRAVFAGAALALAAGSSWAEMTPQELARLGKDLTPVGAERVGNADGTIPAWDGGLTKPPAGFNVAKGYANPFAAEKPLYVITGANLQQYQALLAPGQIEMLKRYPEYKMKVYATHRTAALPPQEYEDIKSEARDTKTVGPGMGVAKLFKSTVPFPIPKNGLEIMYNHEYRFSGQSIQREFVIFPVQTNGGFTPIKWSESHTWGKAMPGSEPNQIAYYLQRTLSPSNVAGEAVLLLDVADSTIGTRKSWTYNPGQRRVLRAPDVAYDTPQFNSDGLGTIDSYDMFNGKGDRYDWKLVGKKEMLISYNNYDMTSKALKYTDVVKANHLNQDLPRYEKHRVWVIEASLKTGARHIYAKRIFYVDEDTWQIAHGDLYDGRGNLWRVQENHAVNPYDVLINATAGQVDYDLQARRAFVMFLMNEEKPAEYSVKRTLADFSVDNLRRSSN
jgi:hypothetical protein